MEPGLAITKQLLSTAALESESPVHDPRWNSVRSSSAVDVGQCGFKKSVEAPSVFGYCGGLDHPSSRWWVHAGDLLTKLLIHLVRL